MAFNTYTNNVELPEIQIKTKKLLENVTVQETSFSVKAPTIQEAIIIIERLKGLFK